MGDEDGPVQGRLIAPITPAANHGITVHVFLPNSTSAILSALGMVCGRRCWQSMWYVRGPLRAVVGGVASVVTSNQSRRYALLLASSSYLFSLSLSRIRDPLTTPPEPDISLGASLPLDHVP